MADPARGRSAGVLAVFDDRRRLLNAIRTARMAHIEPVTAFAPAYDEELVEAAAGPSRTIGAMALGGAIAGCIAGFALTIWTTAQWPTLIVGGKPLLSIPPFVLIAFETTILMASLGAVAAFLRRAAVSRRDSPAGHEPAFTDAHFGLLMRCDGARIPEAIELVREAGALQWRVV